MNGKFLIRGYAPADEAALTALWKRCFGDSEELIHGFFALLPELGAGVTAELDGKAKKSDYKAGKYTITYKAKDSSGNEVTATSKLIIKEKPEEEKKDDEKSEETSDNNNNGNGGNSDNNGGGSSNNNGGGNSNNGGNGGSNSNNNGGNGNGGSQNNGGGSSNSNGGGSSNNNGGGSNSGGQSGRDAITGDDITVPSYDDYVLMHGDPLGWGYEYDYWYSPSTGQYRIG